MKTNKMLWLSIAAAALLITSSAFATDATPATSAGASVAETAKHHGQRLHRGTKHAGIKAKETVKKTEKKLA